MKINEIDLIWLGHSGFLIKGQKIIYVDPYKIQDGREKADIILLTHSHYDHTSIEDIQKIVRSGTRVVMPVDVQSKIARLNVPVEMEIIEPGQELNFGGIKVRGFPAYNVDKSFHPREEGWLGYLIKFEREGLLVYHAGDTDKILEMQKLTGFKENGKKFVALLPIGGRFTMTAEEAFEAVELIKPDISIPMHYGSIVGGKDEVEEFKELCEEKGFNVEILVKDTIQ